MTVVNDAYNANPDSMRAGLEALARWRRPAAGAPGRCSARCSSSARRPTAEHAEIGRLTRKLGVDRLVVVGEGARGIHAGAVADGARDGEDSVAVPDSEAAQALLRDALRPGDVVLFKSSRDAGLRWLGDAVAGEEVGPMRQILLASSFGLIFALFGTPLAIRLLIRRGYGQLIRDDGPTSHHTKRGTPTMGGGVLIIGTLLGYFGAHLVTWRELTVSGLLVLFLMTGLGLVGFLDDYIKVAKQRSLGLRASAQGHRPDGRRRRRSRSSRCTSPTAADYTPASTDISFIRDTSLGLGAVLFVVWAYIMIAGTSNGVNLTDGLDGLATGTSVMVFGSYVLIGIWQFGENCARADAPPNCYEVRDPLDLAVVAAAIMGACFGFLWWNASPAKIFMGDTGSLALGGALAGARDPEPHRAAAGAHRRPVRAHRAVGHRAGRLLQADPETRVPHGAAAAPLRARRVGRGHHRHPLLDHRRAARRARPRGVLRGVGRERRLRD